MLSEGPLGSEITPFRSLLGAPWHHLGPNWGPFGCKMAPPGTPWVPQVSARAPQSHSLWHKSSPEGPQGRPGCPPAPHFGRFSVIWGGHSEGFGVPLGVTSGQGGARLGAKPFCRKLCRPTCKNPSRSAPSHELFSRAPRGIGDSHLDPRGALAARKRV